MKILQICNKPPYPPFDGGAIGMNNVTLGLLNEDVNVDVIAINTPKHFVDEKDIPEDYIKKTNLKLVYINTDIKIIEALANLLFSSKSYHVTRFISKSLENQIIKNITQNDYDIIQLESVFLSPYTDIIRKYTDAKIVLRAPNIEHQIWFRLKNEAKNPLKKYYLKVLSERLKKHEEESIKRFDALYTVTNEDRKFFKSINEKIPSEVIPTGIDILKDLSFNKDEIQHPSIFHLGALDWYPNQEGLRWFLDNVWIEINKKHPDLEFHIAGRRPPKWFMDLKYPNVIIHGEIDNAEKFIKTHSIMIVPLFSGSGMRVKIIEGMMLAKAVVSTSIGAEGLNVENGNDILIADNKEEFFSNLDRLISNNEEYQNITKNAKKSSYNNYSNDKLSKKLISFFKSLIYQ